MKFCFNCGSKLQLNSKFCPECGEKLYKNHNSHSITANEISEDSLDKTLFETTDSKPLKEAEILKPIIVSKYDSNNILKYGAIDLEGSWIIQPLYDKISIWDDSIDVVLNQKHGVLDLDRTIIIPPIFDSIWGFRFAEIDIIPAELKNNFGLIDKKGNWILQPILDEIECAPGWLFEENCFKGKLNGKWGVIDKKGNWIVQPTLDFIYVHEYDGCIRVNFNDKTGFIDRKGNWIIQPVFDDLKSPNNDGFIAALSNEKWGIIDKKGNWIVKAKFDELESFGDEGNSIACINGKCGVINNKTGIWIIQPKYDSMVSYYSPKGVDEKNHLKVELSGKWGVIDINEKWIIQPKYYIVDRIEIGFQVVQDGRIGVLDSNEKWIIPPIIDSINGFDMFTFDDFEIASIGGKWGVIDNRGNWIIQPSLDEIDFDGYNMYKAKSNGKWGVIDDKGNWIVQPYFDEIGRRLVKNEEWSENHIATINNKHGVIDTKGNWIIQPVFDKIGELSDELLYAEINEKWGIVDFKGNQIIPCLYQSIEQIEDTNFFLASINYKTGILDLDGNWKVQPVFDYAVTLNNDEEEDNETLLNESVERHFYHLQNKESLYLWDNCPTKKIKNFKKQFNPDFFTEEGKILVYYDDTLWGKGDNGFLIYDKDSVLYLFVSFYLGTPIGLCFEDDGINNILQSSQMKKSDLILEYCDQDGTEFIEDNHCTNDSWFALNDFINENLPLDIDPDEF